MPANPQYHAIILAGGKDPLAQQHRVAHKALIPFALGTLVSPLLNHLQNCQEVRSVLYVGTPPEHAPIDWHVAASSSLRASLQAGVTASQHYIDGDPWLLLCSSDIPYLSLVGLEHFLAEVSRLVDMNSSLELIYPVVQSQACRHAFPKQRRTSIRLAEGRVTGGNIVVVRRSSLLRLLPWVDDAYRYRKNPWRLAQLVGWQVLWKVMLGYASLDWLEAHISQRLEVQIKVIVSEDAALASDVDSVEHLQALLGGSD